MKWLPSVNVNTLIDPGEAAIAFFRQLAAEF
jgi:hypothetical protein